LVTADSQWHEENGNPGTAGRSPAFTVDTVTPTVKVTIDRSDVNLGEANQLALFAGLDAQGTTGLWVTDGSAAGTHEIGGLGNAGISGVSQGGLRPSNFTIFNGKVLFSGIDAKGASTLWVTDATAAGTHEIGGLGNAGISGANSQFGLLTSNPIDLTVFKSNVLFRGFDANDFGSLWTTDGTPAGTQEVGGLRNIGIPGTSASVPFSPYSFTVFNGQVLFNGAPAITTASG
jgi:hypothetical protein